MLEIGASAGMASTSSQPVTSDIYEENGSIKGVIITTKRFFCTFRKCKYARMGRRGFPRKENWRRHMRNKHGVEGTS